MPPKQRKYAVIIGNSEYLDPRLPKLTAPDSDVRALAKVLLDPEIGNFNSVHISVNKSEAIIRREIARLFAGKSRDDLLLLYYSGHGIRNDRGNLYLAASDTEYDLLSATAIPSTFIEEEMKISRSHRQILILDCCFSGSFASGMKSVVGERIDIENTFVRAGYGKAILTATDAIQYAWEGKELIGNTEKSVFTHYLIHGLESGEADINNDGDITLEELYDFTYKCIRRKGYKQTPSKWVFDQQGTIYIAKNPFYQATSNTQNISNLPQKDLSTQSFLLHLGYNLLFKDLSDDDVRKIFEKCEIALIAPGEVIFQEGDIGSNFYIIYQGNIRLSYYSYSEEEKELGSLLAGDFFGDMSLTLCRPRFFTAWVETETILLYLPKEHFHELLRTYPTVKQVLMLYAKKYWFRQIHEIADVRPSETVYIATKQHKVVLYKSIFIHLLFLLMMQTIVLYICILFSLQIFLEVSVAINMLIFLNVLGRVMEWKAGHYVITDQRVIRVEKVWGIFRRFQNVWFSSILSIDLEIRNHTHKILKIGNIKIQSPPLSMTMESMEYPNIIANAIDQYRERVKRYQQDTISSFYRK